MRSVPTTERHAPRFAEALQILTRTRWNEVTLTANDTTTVVNAPKGVTEDSVIYMMPLTANAAAEIGGGAMFITTARDSFTITHANDAATDRDFRWVALGD